MPLLMKRGIIMPLIGGIKMKLKVLLKNRWKIKRKEYYSSSRGYPNCIGIEQDYLSYGESKIVVLHKEDVEKMEDMSADEKNAYRRQLILEGKYTIKYSSMPSEKND